MQNGACLMICWLIIWSSKQTKIRVLTISWTYWQAYTIIILQLWFWVRTHRCWSKLALRKKYDLIPTWRSIIFNKLKFKFTCKTFLSFSKLKKWIMIFSCYMVVHVTCISCHVFILQTVSKGSYLSMCMHSTK